LLGARPLALAALLPLFLFGCTPVGRIVDPLNISGLGGPPMRIGITKLELSPPPILLPKTSLLQDDLFYYLHQPISFDLMTPHQIRVHLGTGRLKFAMLTPEDFAEVAPGGTCRILAIPKNERKQTSRKGLIVVSAKSSIHSLSELKSLRFHFLPRGSVLNEVAIAALLEAGVAQRDLDGGLLLGLDTYHLNSLEVAKSVVVEEKAAGVIDEAEYNTWKKTGGSLLLLTPSQDEVRVIAETVRVPEGPFVVSNEASPELAEKVGQYLLTQLPKHPFVLASIGCTGFAEPIDAREYEPFFAVYRKLHPAQAQSGLQPQASPASLPAAPHP
jgi:ABC-type phosphate/phosphonate transport system substrate-binding protein